MMPPLNNLNEPSQSAGFALRTLDFRLWTLDFGLRASLLLALTTLAAAPAPEPAPPSTPREFYNAGACQLRAGKLREAEASLESDLASRDERLQAPALY